MMKRVRLRRAGCAAFHPGARPRLGQRRPHDGRLFAYADGLARADGYGPSHPSGFSGATRDGGRTQAAYVAPLTSRVFRVRQHHP